MSKICGFSSVLLPAQIFTTVSPTCSHDFWWRSRQNRQSGQSTVTCGRKCNGRSGAGDTLTVSRRTSRQEGSERHVEGSPTFVKWPASATNFSEHAKSTHHQKWSLQLSSTRHRRKLISCSEDWQIHSSFLVPLISASLINCQSADWWKLGSWDVAAQNFNGQARYPFSLPDPLPSAFQIPLAKVVAHDLGETTTCEPTPEDLCPSLV